MSIVTHKNKPEYGFTLLEITIALTVISVILFGSVGIISKLNEFDEYQANKKYLERVENAFHTFVQVNRYLPCPDINFDGREDRAAGPDFECLSEEGSIPYLNLGVPSQDVWKEPLYYAVNNRADTADIDNSALSASYFNNQTAPVAQYDYNTPPFGANRGVGNYTVCSETAAVCNGGTAGQDVIEFAAIAIVISFGKNAGNTWALRAAGNENQLSGAEEENADDDNFFWQAAGDNRENTNFDDQLFWITAYDMKFAVIKSGGGLPDLP